MRTEILGALEAKFAKHPVLMAGPVPAVEIADLERNLGYPLPLDYKLFVERFGGAVVGPYSIFGLRASEAMGEDESSALMITRRFRDQQWPGADSWLVISMDHAGNPFGLDKDGRVWISDHDAGVVEKVAESFEGFVRSRCLKLE
jgi:hypothetical protein